MVKFQRHLSQYKNLHWTTAIEKGACKMSDILSQPQFVKQDRNQSPSQAVATSQRPQMLRGRSRNCDCLVILLSIDSYQLIAKPGNKTATISWPDPYRSQLCDWTGEKNTCLLTLSNMLTTFNLIYCGQSFYVSWNENRADKGCKLWKEINQVRRNMFCSDTILYKTFTKSTGNSDHFYSLKLVISVYITDIKSKCPSTFLKKIAVAVMKGNCQYHIGKKMTLSPVWFLPMSHGSPTKRQLLTQFINNRFRILKNCPKLNR